MVDRNAYLYKSQSLQRLREILWRTRRHVTDVHFAGVNHPSRATIIRFLCEPSHMHLGGIPSMPKSSSTSPPSQYKCSRLQVDTHWVKISNVSYFPELY